MDRERVPQLQKTTTTTARGHGVPDQSLFWLAFGVTAFAGLAAIAMAFVWPHPTDIQQQAYGAMDSAWKVGFGALIGLFNTLKRSGL